MAAIIECTLATGETEVVVLWSDAFLQEIDILYRDNPDIIFSTMLHDYPGEGMCEEAYMSVKSKNRKIKYRLPKKYIPNRKVEIE